MKVTRRETTSVIAICAAMISFTSCTSKSPTNSTVNTSPVNSGTPGVSSIRTAKEKREAMLPEVNKWFADHKQRYASALDDGGQVVVNIPGLKLSADNEKVAIEFAAAMGKQLTDAGFANDFRLTDLSSKVSKTYEFKSIDVRAREAVLPAIDLWFISQKKINATSRLDPSDDTKLIITSPAFNDDNHVTTAVEFGIKYGKQLRDLGFNPSFAVTNGKQSWPHKLY